MFNSPQAITKMGLGYLIFRGKTAAGGDKELSKSGIRDQKSVLSLSGVSRKTAQIVLDPDSSMIGEDPPEKQSSIFQEEELEPNMNH